MRYPLSYVEDTLRTHESFLKDMEKAIRRGSSVKGVKCLSALAHGLPCFDSIWSYAYEYMHYGQLGLPKQINEHHTTPRFWNGFDESFHLKSKERGEINSRLCCIRSPQEIHRLPRSLTEK